MWARSGGGSGRIVTRQSMPPVGAHPEGESHEPYRITVIPARDAESVLPAYRRCEAGALDADPFNDPRAITASAVHDPALRDLRLVCIWRDGELHGLIPLKPTGGFLRGRRWQVPLLDAAATGAPFLHQDAAPGILDTLRDWLAGRGCALAFTALRADTRLAGLLRAPAEQGLVQLRQSCGTQAPGAGPGATAAAAATTTPGMVLDRIGDAGGLRDAVETHLLQEARIAMASGREALVQRSGAANRIRTLTRSLGHDKRCQAFCLRDHTGPRAVALVLHTREQAVLWRMSIDPDAGIAADWMRNRILRAISQRRASVVDASDGFPGTGRLEVIWPVTKTSRAGGFARRLAPHPREGGAPAAGLRPEIRSESRKVKPLEADADRLKRAQSEGA